MTNHIDGETTACPDCRKAGEVMAEVGKAIADLDLDHELVTAALENLLAFGLTVGCDTYEEAREAIRGIAERIDRTVRLNKDRLGQRNGGLN